MICFWTSPGPSYCQEPTSGMEVRGLVCGCKSGCGHEPASVPRAGARGTGTGSISPTNPSPAGLGLLPLPTLSIIHSFTHSTSMCWPIYYTNPGDEKDECDMTPSLRTEILTFSPCRLPHSVHLQLTAAPSCRRLRLRPNLTSDQ